MAVVAEVQAADRRSARTREALLHVFLDLLFERGYEALSVRDIAARANVGRSTFYEHFAGKDALLFVQVLLRSWAAKVPSAGNLRRC